MKRVRKRAQTLEMPFHQVNGRLVLCYSVSMCMSGCLHVTGSCPETPLAQFSAISPSHLGSGPQLCSC